MIREKETKFERRNIGLDLLKVVCIFAIIVHHLILRSTNLRLIAENSFNMNDLVFAFINSFLIVAVNCFFLISGYCGIRGKFSKVLRIVIETYILFWVVNILFVIYEYPINSELVKSCIFPISKYWYIFTYVVLSLLAPFINRLTDNLEEKEYRRLLLILLCVYSGYSFLIDNNIFGANGGCSLPFAIIVYLIGGYINKFEISVKSQTIKILLYTTLCILCGIGVIVFFKDLNPARAIALSRLGRYTLYVYIFHSMPVVIDFFSNLLINIIEGHNALFKLCLILCFASLIMVISLFVGWGTTLVSSYFQRKLDERRNQ